MELPEDSDAGEDIFASLNGPNGAEVDVHAGGDEATQGVAGVAPPESQGAGASSSAPPDGRPLAEASPALNASSLSAASVAPEPSELRVIVPTGKITWYRKDGRFEAVCRQHQLEGSGEGCMCRMTRTSRPSERKAAQGRPLGFLGAWLAAAQSHQDRDSHRSKMWLATGIARQQRVAARACLRQLPGGAELLSCERPKADSEDSEPEGMP